MSTIAYPQTAGQFLDAVIAARRSSCWALHTIDAQDGSAPIVRWVFVSAGRVTGDAVTFGGGLAPRVVFASGHFFELGQLHADENWPVSRKLRAAAWFGTPHKVLLQALHEVIPPPAGHYHAEAQVQARLKTLLSGFETPVAH